MGPALRPRPRRTCVACRTERDKRALVRVVKTPDGQTVIDPSGRLAGRGAYLCADGSCWQTALRRRSIEHALGVALTPETRALLAVGPADVASAPSTMTPSEPASDPDTHEGGSRGT
ncbi:MAG TPA: YlxR family protein [Candidatus Limnocylindrales bacterium]|nr:YlxR family protein [Candidatus Limnocylindrales bacterium]